MCENDCDEVVELKRFKTETKLLVKNKNATTRIAEKIAKAGSNLEGPIIHWYRYASASGCYRGGIEGPLHGPN